MKGLTTILTDDSNSKKGILHMEGPDGEKLSIDWINSGAEMMVTLNDGFLVPTTECPEGKTYAFKGPSRRGALSLNRVFSIEYEIEYDRRGKPRIKDYDLSREYNSASDLARRANAMYMNQKVKNTFHVKNRRKPK